MTVKSRTWQTLAEPKYGKPLKILVWTNGDFESFGQEVKINPKYLRSWNTVLNFLTVVLQPRFGAVRKLYHLETKKMVDCLHNIRPGDRFVATGGEKARFKKNGYLTEEERQEESRGKPSKQSIKIPENVKSILNFIAYTKKKNRTVIYVMVSGRTCQEPLKVVLTAADLLVWNMVLEYLGYQLDVAEGVDYLCKTNGRIIVRSSQIQHGEVYVAVPFNNRFVKMDYLKLFSELRPPKKINLRNPKKAHSSSVFQIKKKYRKKKPISPSLAVFPGSAGTLSPEVRCLSIKCLHDECRLASGPRTNSTAEAQTVISTASIKSHQPLPEDYFSDGKADDGKVHILDTNLEAYESYHREKAEESANSDEYEGDEGDERDEGATFESEMELIKSILEEIIDHCVLELEHKGVISPPHLSATMSMESIPRADKVFVPDPIERKSREFLHFPGRNNMIADCCSGKMKKVPSKDKEKTLTTFAEIAQKSKQRQEIPLLAGKRTSQTSISEMDGYVKSVSFSASVLPLAHQEIIYEEDEPIRSTLPFILEPRSSILKLPKMDKHSSCFKNLDDPSGVDMHTKFKLNVHTDKGTEPHSDIDTEEEEEAETARRHSDTDSEEEKTQEMYERLRRTSSFSKRPRDSLMVTASRLSKMAASASTQKNLEDSGENDKSVQTFEDDSSKGSSAANIEKSGESISGNSKKDESNNERLGYSASNDYSDIYENYGSRENGSIELEEDGQNGPSFSCCGSKTNNDSQDDTIRTSNNSLNKTKTKSQQNSRTNESNQKNGSRSKSNQGISNNGNIYENDDDIEFNIARRIYKNNIDETQSSNFSNVEQNMEAKSSSLKVINVGCLRENCAFFSCSEICLKPREKSSKLQI